MRSRTPVPVMFYGETMGTTYTVRAFLPMFLPPSLIVQGINRQLEVINRAMSTYLEESEISTFNRFQSTEVFPVSSDFMALVLLSKKINTISGGYFDITINPLVTLWQFRQGQPSTKPSAARISDVLASIGQEKLIVNETSLQKSDPRLELDFSAIAKGYAVDDIVELLDRVGVNTCFVEIGGEVRTRGTKLNDVPWRVGIRHPFNDGLIENTILRNQSLATSGNYEQTFVLGKQRFSHVINPKTGSAETTSVLSVSVRASTCAFADGLATALMLLPVDRALNIVNELQDVECLIISTDVQGQLRISKSKDW